MSIPTSGPGTGLFHERTVYKMVSTLAVVAGDIVTVTLATIDSTTVVQNTVDQPVTGDLELGIFAVALEAVAAGATGPFLFRGMVDARGVTTHAAGTVLAATNAADTLTATAATQKAIAYALETGVVASPGAKVFFNGIEGFGNDNA